MPKLNKILLILFVSATLSACSTTHRSGFPNSAPKTPKSDKALIHAKLARGYLQQEQYAVAKTELDKALRLDRNHSESNYVMALLMLELKQYEEAEGYFAQAVRSNSANSAAAHDYGVFLCRIGQERKALEYFEIAVKNPLFDRSELSYMRAGECLARVGDTSAERYLREALKINPNLRPALYRLAQINYDRGQYLSARAYIERYFAITTPKPAALFLAYRIELKNGAHDVAAQYRIKLLDEFPGSTEAGSLRGAQR